MHSIYTDVGLNYYCMLSFVPLNHFNGASAQFPLLAQKIGR